MLTSLQYSEKLRNVHSEKNIRIVFFFFCIWAFVLLSRPQDIFHELKIFRPALIFAFLTLGFAAIKFNNLRYPSLFRERQITYITALLFVMIIGIPTALHRRITFEEIFTGYFINVLFVFVFYKIIHSTKTLSTVILIGCLGSGFYSAYGLVEYDPRLGRLAYGTMFDPNDLVYFAIGFLPLNLLFMHRDNSLWVRLACLCSFSASILLILNTGSRGGFLSLVVVTLLLLLSKNESIGAPLKIMVIGIIFAVLTLASVNTERFQSIFNIKEDYNVTAETGRIQLWKIGIETMLENPLSGVGVGNYVRAVGLDRQARNAETLRWQSPHSSVIQIGAETGILGLIIFLLSSLNVVRILNKVGKQTTQERLSKICQMGVIGFTGLFISGLFLSQAYSIYWLFYIAVSAVINQLMVSETIQAAPAQMRGV